MNISDSVLSYVSVDDILSDSDELTLFISRTGTVILINNQGSEILGYPPGDIIGKNWFEDFIPASVRENILDGFQSQLATESVFKQDYQVLCADETEKSVSWNNRTVTDEDGIVMCILVSGHTIDESREPPNEIAYNEEVYRTLVENSNDAIIIHKNGTIQYANSTASLKTGYSEDELLGMNVLDLVTAEYRPIVIKNISDRIAGQEAPSIYRIEVLCKTGDIIPSEINVSLISFNGDRTYMVLLRDLSQRQIYEEQLRHSQKMEAIGQLAGGVAHDFNNILQVINGYTELVQASLDETNPAQEMLQQVSQAGDRASSLVRQLLTFSRNQLIVTNILDLNAVITEHLTMLKRLIGENIILEFLSSNDAIHVNCDHSMLGQILLNICLNSKDAMTQGGEILVKTETTFLDSEFCKANPSAEEGDYAMISISDNGCGMDKETLSRVFEPFFSTKDITEGTGLGLSTVYGIVNQHDGIITASSKADNGSTFRIYLPLTEINDEIEEQLPDIVNTDDTSRTIIITEDDENVRNLACEILSEAGHEVITASNGEEAVLLISDSPDSVDLIILDVIMPVLGGYEAADRIREIRPDMPLVFCSGYTEGQNHKNIQQDLERSLFLSKPYSMTQLLTAINELLSEKP